MKRNTTVDNHIETVAKTAAAPMHYDTRTAAASTTLSPSTVRPRRSPRWIAIGVLAMALGGIGGAAVWTQSTGAEPVVKMVRDVPRGETVQATDLAVVNLTRSPEVVTVPAADLNALVGKTATTDLRANTLVAPGSVGEVNIERGMVHLGLALPAGRLPSSIIPAGSRVQLISVNPTPGAPPAANTRLSVTAMVVREPHQNPDGVWIVDIAVAEGQAEAVAERAAANQLVLARKASR